jgi:hypothetical protein
VNKQRRIFLGVSICTALSALNGGSAAALDNKRPERFSSDERRIIEDFYHQGKKAKQKGLPPGCSHRPAHQSDSRYHRRRNWLGDRPLASRQFPSSIGPTPIVSRSRIS